MEAAGSDGFGIITSRRSLFSADSAPLRIAQQMDVTIAMFKPARRATGRTAPLGLAALEAQSRDLPPQTAL